MPRLWQLVRDGAQRSKRSGAEHLKTDRRIIHMTPITLDSNDIAPLKNTYAPLPDVHGRAYRGSGHTETTHNGIRRTVSIEMVREI